MTIASNDEGATNYMPVRFQVDPDFYDHPKTTGMSDAAFSLWVRAGSFSAAKLTDGFITDNVLAHTLRSSEDVAGELVGRGLWRRVKGGYRFHEWDVRNLTRKRVEGDRESDRARKRKARGDGSNSAGQNGNQQATPGNVRPESERNPAGIQTESEGIPAVSVSVSVSESVSGSGRGGPRPDPTCLDHRDDPDPPACRKCRTAREAAEAWDAAYAVSHAMADAHGRDKRPQCPKHRGQLAHNCAPCRAEQLAPPSTEETP